MPTATVKLFLLTGDPKGLRTAEISNWSGKALAAPRIQLDELLQREELSRPGVYVLSGVDPETGKPMVYIGEAEILRDRLKQHRTKDFWVSAMVFLSKDENLTKAHVRFLEGRLIGDAKAIGRFLLDNVQGGGSKLPESDREDMEVFLEKIRLLMPVLGSDLVTPLKQTGEGGAKPRMFHCTIKGLVAHGQRTSSGFVVAKGSQAVKTHRKNAPVNAKWILDIRDRLINERALTLDGDHLVFSRDVEFASPSAAAGVVRGGTAAGPIAWKTKDGTTLKEIDEGQNQ